MTTPEAPAVSLSKAEKIERIFGSATNIPTLPVFLARIVEMTQSMNTSAEDLNEIIARDPSLTSQILRAANSAFYGFPNKIGTVTLAIIILGFNMVRTTALSSWVLKHFSKPRNGAAVIDVRAFWTHSFKCGVACRMLVSEKNQLLAGEAFTMGILHDIGRIALAFHAPTFYTQVAQRHTEKKESLLHAEEAVLGFNHAELGAFFLERWNLPPVIVEGVKFHHAPGMAVKEPEMVAIAHLADHLCHLDDFKKGLEKNPPLLNAKVWKYIPRERSEKEELQRFLEKFEEEFKKSEGLLDILKDHGR